MRLTDLQYAPEYPLLAHSVLHRIQRIRSRAGAVSVGPLRLPPAGLLVGRFDLSAEVVGYFAESPETAIYETLARREATLLSLADIGKRLLLSMRASASLNLLDLRPHAATWPVLQSLRYASTQMLAHDARRQGFEGVVYRSAQQHGRDCYALFGDAMNSLRAISKTPLLEPKTGALHRAAAIAIRGSQISLAP
ncbi:hypothetical protein BH11PSE9_BH11PSE9_04060 [soil metagenome]